MDFKEFVDKVKEFEGLRLTAYKCPSGVLTIGYGHTHGVVSGMKITEDFADYLLMYDLSIAKLQLKSFFGLNFWQMLSPGMRFALIDFVFNVGYTKFKNSSLATHLKSKAPTDAIACQLYQWTRSKGVVLKGLEKRRAWEVSLIYEK